MLVGLDNPMDMFRQQAILFFAFFKLFRRIDEQYVVLQEMQAVQQKGKVKSPPAKPGAYWVSASKAH